MRGAPDILWAEDNLQDQILIRTALEGTKARVTFANDGVLFLEALERRKPDLGVLDLKMPRIGGLEALRRMRQDARWAKLPVAVFSAGEDLKESEECRALGTLAVVQKPVNFEAFTGAVQYLVRLASG